MKTFISIGVPAILCALSIIGLACERRRERKAREHQGKDPVPPRIRRLELRRLAWYKLTRRMPRYKGGRESQGRPLTLQEWRTFDAIRSAEKRRQPYAPEPQHGRAGGEAA